MTDIEAHPTSDRLSTYAQGRLDESEMDEAGAAVDTSGPADSGDGADDDDGDGADGADGADDGQ